MLLENVQKKKKKAHFCSRVNDIGLDLSDFLELLNNQVHAALNAKVPATIGYISTDALNIGTCRF